MISQAPCSGGLLFGLKNEEHNLFLRAHKAGEVYIHSAVGDCFGAFGLKKYKYLAAGFGASGEKGGDLTLHTPSLCSSVCAWKKVFQPTHKKTLFNQYLHNYLLFICLLAWRQRGLVQVLGLLVCPRTSSAQLPAFWPSAASSQC